MSSSNKGNFLELSNFLANHNKVIHKVIKKNAHENLKLTVPTIHKDIIRSTTSETTKAILLVIVAKKHIGVALFFNLVANIFNIVGASCIETPEHQKKNKRKIFCKIKSKKIAKRKSQRSENLVKNSSRFWFPERAVLISERAVMGVNFVRDLGVRNGSTWNKVKEHQSPHLAPSLSLLPSMIDVLEIVEEDGISLEQKGEACALLNSMQTFEFVFTLHLMLVLVSKQRLQAMRDDGWSSLLNNVPSFCEKHSIVVLNMNDTFQTQERLQELNNHFTEVNTELLLCVACINPRDSFSIFDKEKLIELALILLVATASIERAFSAMNIYHQELDAKSYERRMIK
uniref:DUF4371 domain-containing protein n=1 Tax=Cajanus cajan TaxID=3821 RepID=A0A151T4C3_CAJCA|nr:hypothetical protein KK1_016419 [Cajanus cajan]